MTRKIFMCVIMAFVLCGAAHADIAYTTSDGGLGLIKINGESSIDVKGIQYQGSASNPLVAPYWTGGNSRLAVISRTTDTTTSGDTVMIFSPSDMTKPLTSSPVVLEGIYNAQDVSYSNNGRGLFITSGTKITQFSPENFGVVRSFDFAGYFGSRDSSPESHTVLTSSRIYTLVDSGDNESAMFSFDGQLTQADGNMSVTRIRYRANSMAWLNNSSIALAHSRGVYIIGGGNMSSDIPVISLCPDSSYGFYFITQDSSGNSTLSHYGVNISTDLHTDNNGGSVIAVRDASYNVLAAKFGGKIRLYRMKDDTFLGEYDSSQLGGVPVSMAVTSSSGSEGNDSSSGCNLSGIGAVMAGVCLLLLRRKRI
ncbi:MAG: hypothetical protein IJQ58_06080 [Synergistaceae bacterium]|nr:hypothetical protein [Synergistaceae bacterium]